MTESFVYEPLDQQYDCTRLIYIDPSPEPGTGHPQCQVVQVRFSDRPKYRALSYMWGDETWKNAISLNGKRFTVTANLSHALDFLRRAKFEGPFWIDAICINQDDVQEKNRQIRIMPHIYFRASAVLVWLGMYSKAEVVEEAKGGIDTIRRSLPPSTSALEKATFRLLGDCGYWKRLWVVQEIGKAASIEVCYAVVDLDKKPWPLVEYQDHSISWADFIPKIRSLGRNSDKAGALRLDDQLRNKNRGSHTLGSLLEAHHEALCKNPRDKVYGLAGLAEDCYGFPVDYSKSLFEVWTDTLRFLQQSGQVKDNLAALAGIMMNALGGPSQVMPPPGIISSINLELRLLLIGTMASIGPTCEEIVGKLGAGDDWAACVYRRDKTALQLNETMVRNILRAKDPGVPSLEIHSLSTMGENSLVWLPEERMGGDCSSRIEKGNQQDFMDRRRCEQDSTHIYLLSCLSHRGESGWIGTAKGDFAEGDLFCYIPGTAKTLVLRATTHITDEQGRHAVSGNGKHAFVVGVTTGEDESMGYFGLDRAQLWKSAYTDAGSPHVLSMHISADALFTILYSQHL